MRRVLRLTRVRVILAVAAAAAALVLLVPAGGALELQSDGQAPASSAAPAPGAAPVAQPQAVPARPAPAPGGASAFSALNGQTSEAANVLGAAEPALPRMIIGTNGGAGWGTQSAEVILGGHITWDRFSV